LAPLPRFATAGSDKSVKIWEYNEGTLIFGESLNHFKEESNKIIEIACLDGPDGHTDWVRDVAFCPRPDATEIVLVSASEVSFIFFIFKTIIGWNNYFLEKFQN